MKKVLPLVICMCVSIFMVESTNAQDVKLPGLDVSPADIAILRVSREAPPIARIVYGRPQMKGRSVFGSEDGALVPYGKLWRTGANETTQITFYQDVTFGGEEVEAGTYSLYTIPGEDEWTVVLNSKLHTWGHFQYDESKDVVRVQAESEDYEPSVEAFTIKFEPPAEGSEEAMMYMAWENTLVKVPVKP